MDTPIEEQQIFQKVTCKLAASEDEITEPDILSIDYINYVSQMSHWLLLAWTVWDERMRYNKVVVKQFNF